MTSKYASCPSSRMVPSPTTLWTPLGLLICAQTPAEQVITNTALFFLQQTGADLPSGKGSPLKSFGGPS